jgi:hypothetical protein
LAIINFFVFTIVLGQYVCNTPVTWSNPVSKTVFPSVSIISKLVLFSTTRCSVRIATRYGLDGPGIESRWRGRDFPQPSRPALVPTQPPIRCVPSLSRG